METADAPIKVIRNRWGGMLCGNRNEAMADVMLKAEHFEELGELLIGIG